MKKKRIKLPTLKKVKKALYDHWSGRVKERDGHKCVLCGNKNNLTAHHWCISDHFAHAARYSLDNGITLCYTCHIRGIHCRADYAVVMPLFDTILHRENPPDIAGIKQLAKVELTTEMLRAMWDKLPKRH